MKVKAIIKTPKGEAKKAEKKLQMIILGMKKFDRFTSYVNEDDSEVVWEVEDREVRKIMKLQKDISKFDVFAKMLMDNKWVKSAIRDKMSPEQQAQINNMILEQTHIEILTPATTEELVEFNKTWWQRMKEKFKPIC